MEIVMKPEHAQEIYEMLKFWTITAADPARDGTLKRARELLGLERPDVPEPGTVVECYWEFIIGRPVDWFLARVHDFKDGKREVEHMFCDDGLYVVDVYKWRYPGEKEWRE
jgi:hypothetical protein